MEKMVNFSFLNEGNDFGGNSAQRSVKLNEKSLK